MRNFVLSLAALAALSFAVPFAAPAQAETVVVHHHHHHWWHGHHNKTVVIKHDHDMMKHDMNHDMKHDHD